MPKPRPKAPAPEPKQPSVDDRSRRAFLDELEGKVPVESEPMPPQRRVKVDADTSDDETVVDQPADGDLAAVLPERPATKAAADRFERAPRASRWWIWVIGAVVLAGVAVAGFLFFSRSSKFSGSNVGVAIDAPSAIASGDSVTITIKYHNDETVDLQNATLAVTYPTGFTVGQTTPDATGDFHGVFELGTIRSGRVGEVTIIGQAVGAVGTELTISATMSYRPANYNSDFQATDSATMTIASSSVTLNFSGPASIAPGVEGTWVIEYKNTSDHPLEGLQVEATLPTGLTVTTADPKPTDGNQTWRLSKLDSGATGKISLTGLLAGSSGDSSEFSAVLNLVQPGNVTERQAEATWLTAIAESGLSVAVAANGATTDSVIKPGDAVTYSIQLENSHDTELHDVTVAATLTGALFDLAKRQDPAKGTLKDKTITWAKQQLPVLGLIKAKATVTITLTVPTIAPTPAKADGDRNPQVAISLTVTSPDIPTTGAKATALVTKIQTIMTFAADARYYDDQGQALGSGPVPPKVGQTTNYRILWSVATTTNDVTSFSVSAVLPTQVLWTGKNISRDAGNISFDPATRTVTWNINSIPGGTGSRYPVLRAAFEVAITPTADQVGSVVVLTEAASATGVDGSTKQSLAGTAESLTSDVPNDPTAGGEGKVVP